MGQNSNLGSHLLDSSTAVYHKIIYCSKQVFDHVGFSLMQGWKILCFRDDSLSPENPLPDYLDHLLPEESVKPEFDRAIVVGKDWKTKLSEVNLALSFVILMMWQSSLVIL